MLQNKGGLESLVKIFMWLLVFQHCVCQDDDVAEPCEIGGVSGVCVPLPTCAPFYTLLKNYDTLLQGLQITKERQCGFHGANSKVCCPNEEEVQPDLPVTDNPSFKQNNDDFVDELPGPKTCGHVPGSSAQSAWNGMPVKNRAMAKWMALLGYKDAPVFWQCGGSIITSHHVLTAAHCIKRNLYIARVGELDFANEDQAASPIDFTVKKTIPHENYTKFHNDIAIVVLDGNIEFEKHDHIAPVCLPVHTNNEYQKIDTHTFITGWGETEKAGQRSTHLLYAYLDILDREHCARAYRGKNVTIDARVLCAGDAAHMRDACNGDSGGPLITKYYLIKPKPVEEFYGSFYYQVGIISYGFRCSHQRFSGVYTNVAYFMPWIQGKVLGPQQL